MKSVSFITIHFGANFGSVLQTIATSRILKDLNCKVTCINYIQDRWTWNAYFKVRNPFRLVKRILNSPIEYANRHIYQSYLEKYVELTPKIYRRNFFKKCPKSDFYITGSDQVWNSKHNQGVDTIYYFNNIEAKKVAYASSFGQEQLDEKEYDSVKQLLSSYNHISVREESGKKIVESMGFHAEHLLDPTFMLNKDEWQEYMNPRRIKEDYLLVYTPYNTVDKQAIFEAAYAIAKENNLKVVTFSWDWRKDKMADQTIRYANPGDFLSLMHYATYVITNSFHGTAFSINLNKQFSVFMPSVFSTRIRSLIELCGLQNRVVLNAFSSEKAREVIDYTSVNEVLEAERKKSIDFLKQALS